MAKKIKIIDKQGNEQEAHCPIIISASRSTDIPAFYAKWFINRLKAGYVVWYNPFNQKPMHISFRDTKAIVFWTKNPAPLIPYLKEIDAMGIKYYFQFTLNDYEFENLEPNVPKLQDRISTFKKLSELLGKERVIWRFDPLITTPTTSPRELLTRIWRIGNELKGYTEKLVFSFIDVKAYRKVQNNLIKETNLFTKDVVEFAEPTTEQITEICEGLKAIQTKWREEGWDILLATCAEEVDLSRYGIEHNKCVDGELMKRIFADNVDLVHYINYGKMPIKQDSLFPEFDTPILKLANMKDKGQRKVCGCMVSKDIGMYNTCLHHCVYCYANTSRNVVISNVNNLDDDRESILK
ncbi:MAG: DUF1848 domain-containing protein [Rikenellaceae bacterium]